MNNTGTDAGNGFQHIVNDQLRGALYNMFYLKIITTPFS